MPAELGLDKIYTPREVEGAIYQRWLKANAFRAQPDDRPPQRRFTIVIPPPNVTGALHLGHALNNTLQDILIRWHRMRGDNTLWLPGTDHAGIATQAVVEKRILKEEGQSRHDIGREALVARIWEWKDQYEKRILAQLQLIGCSCDWDRTRFTLDEGLTRAVRHTFFRFFKEGLIFRGKRLVNWDTQLQTAVADDEVEPETVKGHFWHFRYPVNNPGPGEPTHVVIATTRPETMLGDVAVAVNPDPAAALEAQETALRAKLAEAPAREKAAIQAELEALLERRSTHLPQLVRLRDMAAAGRTLTLPLVDREIPLVCDKHAHPTLGSGCVKITPAHDHNDYEVATRCKLPMLNMMNPNGTINAVGKQYEGLSMPEGRKRVVADMEAAGLLEAVEDREIQIGHSERSKTPIEPYLSDQWFVRMGELAQSAIDAVQDGRVRFFPERYAKTYIDWLAEKRDWCISRQLWWGHQIPVWSKVMKASELCTSGRDSDLDCLTSIVSGDPTVVVSVFEIDGMRVWHNINDQSSQEWRHLRNAASADDFSVNVMLCIDAPTFYNKQQKAEFVRQFKHLGATPQDYSEESIRSGVDRVERYAVDAGFQRDPDVLDTWFSSALWPYSTLGWPEQTKDLAYYYPGSVLITSRDIITNWVARMVLTGLYNMGEIPFPHVYIHTKILDGRGDTMSKSKGNGVDPVDVCEVYGADALRYTMADMATETQDVRMPVDYICPHCKHATPQASVVPKGKIPADVNKVKCSACKKDFATQWAPAALRQELGVAKESSEKFEIGRNFCNKLWNSARFAFLNLEGTPHEPLDIARLPAEDRWILAQLSATIRGLYAELGEYHYALSLKLLRDFFWDSFCDWYIELSKPRLRDPATAGPARQVLAFVLDQTLRLLSPFLPFITERLWEELNRLVPQRGLPDVVEAPKSELLIQAAFPPAGGYPALDDPAVREMFEDLQGAVRGIRDLRNKCNVPNRQHVEVTIKAAAHHLELIRAEAHVLAAMADVGKLHLATTAERPKNAGTTVVGPLQIFVHDISDDAAERQRLQKELESVEKRLAGAEGKLNNAQFVANAKPEVIEAERQRLAELKKSQQAICESLADLGG